MDGYYENTLSEIRSLIEKKDYERAMRMLEEELSMPYIDRQFEPEFLKLRDEVRFAVSQNREVRDPVLTDQEVSEYLSGTPEQQMSAVRFLENQNLRKKKKVLEEFFLKEGADTFVRGILINFLHSQEIGDVYRVKEEGRIREFVPSRIDVPDTSEAVAESLKYIREWLMSKEPSAAEMAAGILAEEAFRRLPYLWNLSESAQIALSVTAYVFKVSCRSAEFDDWREKNGLNHLLVERLFVEMAE